MLAGEHWRSRIHTALQNGPLCTNRGKWIEILWMLHIHPVIAIVLQEQRKTLTRTGITGIKDIYTSLKDLEVRSLLLYQAFFALAMSWIQNVFSRLVGLLHWMLRTYRASMVLEDSVHSLRRVRPTGDQHQMPVSSTDSCLTTSTVKFQGTKSSKHSTLYGNASSIQSFFWV